MAQSFNLGTLGQVLTVNTTGNSATYTSAIVVGNSSVNVVVNSSSVYVNGSPVGGATNVASQYAWTNTQSFSNTITFTGPILANTVNATSFTTGNSTSNVVANSIMVVASLGHSNPNTFNMGSYTTVTGINTLLAGPFTISTGNTLVITAGSRVVVL